MTSLIGVLLGAVIGMTFARRRGGNLLDMLQYAAIFGMIIGLLALIGTVIAVRSGWI